jgi:hypothetical protein
VVVIWSGNLRPAMTCLICFGVQPVTSMPATAIP